jgi:hypothetical protein
MPKETDEQLKDIEAEIKKQSKISDIGKTEGGEEFIKRLGKDITHIIDEIIAKHRTVSHIELVSIIAKLSVILNIWRELTRAEKRKTEEKKAYDKRLKELLE